MWRLIPASVVVVFCASTAVHALDVYQDLDEATARIERMKDKPYAKLIDKDGYHQSETLIFKDTETACEVWSLTMEECIEMANIERRNVFSCDGSPGDMAPPLCGSTRSVLRALHTAQTPGMVASP